METYLQYASDQIKNSYLNIYFIESIAKYKNYKFQSRLIYKYINNIDSDDSQFIMDMYRDIIDLFYRFCCSEITSEKHNKVFQDFLKELIVSITEYDQTVVIDAFIEYLVYGKICIPFFREQTFVFKQFCKNNIFIDVS